jgi:hypothetical protein
VRREAEARKARASNSNQPLPAPTKNPPSELNSAVGGPFFNSLLDARSEDRDDVVVAEIDRLCQENIQTRGAFLSDMLCLMFPDDYPLLNEPVQRYRSDRLEPPRGASEGVCFLDLAKKLRLSLLQNPKYPAQNLAELDAVIWLSYHAQE